MAQNIKKSKLYEQLKAIITKPNLADEDKQQLLSIIADLEKGHCIQDNCSSIMQFLVQDLLDYSQIKEGKFRKNYGLFNVAEAIEEVMSIQRDKALDKGIEFRAEFRGFADMDGSQRDASQLMINTDGQRLKQVILNLQSNALKFTQRGSVVIVAELLGGGDSQYLRVSVEDTGVGISEEDQTKLFKLFGFLENTKQLNTSGIGLGLVISDQIVRQFGGTFSVKSQPNRGSVFSFTFSLENDTS